MKEISKIKENGRIKKVKRLMSMKIIIIITKSKRGKIYHVKSKENKLYSTKLKKRRLDIKIYEVENV